MSNESAHTRLTKAYDYLRFTHILENHQDLADKLGASRPNVTRALAGDPRYCTENFLKRFAAAYSEHINTEYLLTGEGEMYSKNESLPVISYTDGVPYYDEDFLLGFEEIGTPGRENP